MYVPNLTQKLKLLVEYGAAESMKDLAEGHFAVPVKTLYGWGQNRADRQDGDRIPAKHLPKLISVLEDLLGSEVSHERIITLLGLNEL